MTMSVLLKHPPPPPKSPLRTSTTSSSTTTTTTTSNRALSALRTIPTISIVTGNGHSQSRLYKNQQQQQQQPKLQPQNHRRSSLSLHSFPLLQWAAYGAYMVLLFLCFLILLTLLDLDAPAPAAVSMHSLSSSTEAQNNNNPVVANTLHAIHQQKIIQQQNQQQRQERQEKSHNHTTIINHQRQQHPDATATIGFAVTITTCGAVGDTVNYDALSKQQQQQPPFPITEGAAVLKHSIHQNSIHGHRGGQYDYVLYGIYHPSAASCAQTLADLGFVLIPRDTPVRVQDIQGDYLRQRIAASGCCGEKELLKLEAFTFTQHPIMVLTDLDFIFLKPIDDLFDYMLSGKPIPPEQLHDPKRPLPRNYSHVSLLYTVDYAMVNPGRKIKPVQGGFVVLRPDVQVYRDFVQIVQEGDFRDKGGWGGVTKKFWGGMTFQGLLPYYYLVLHGANNHNNNNTAVGSIELNRCIHNNMCSQPRENKTNQCFTNDENNCEDCRLRDINTIVSAHFTLCQKPWLCWRHYSRDVKSQLCRDLHHAWFAIRSDLERSWGRSGIGTAPTTWADYQHFFGYCSSRGAKGYQLIAQPYGEKIITTNTNTTIHKKP